MLVQGGRHAPAGQPLATAEARARNAPTRTERRPSGETGSACSRCRCLATAHSSRGQAMFTGDISTRGSNARARSLRVLRISLVIAGVIGGAILPFIAREIASARSNAYLSQLDE